MNFNNNRIINIFSHWLSIISKKKNLISTIMLFSLFLISICYCFWIYKNKGIGKRLNNFQYSPNPTAVDYNLIAKNGIPIINVKVKPGNLLRLMATVPQFASNANIKQMNFFNPSQFTSNHVKNGAFPCEIEYNGAILHGKIKFRGEGWWHWGVPKKSFNINRTEVFPVCLAPLRMINSSLKITFLIFSSIEFPPFTYKFKKNRVV